MSASVNVEVVIKDACILFDLIDLGLLDCFYQLRLTVITTPEVLAEVTDDNQSLQIQHHIDNGNLHIDTFGVWETILEIVENSPGLSLTDAAVLEAATRRDAAILSSDKSLRNESNRRGIPVKGLLWVLEELYRQGILTLNVAIEKLKAYPEVNKRAPKSEIERLIQKLSE